VTRGVEAPRARAVLVTPTAAQERAIAGLIAARAVGSRAAAVRHLMDDGIELARLARGQESKDG
jgi:hypothetical protein